MLIQRKIFSTIIILLFSISAFSQITRNLNTAAHCNYLSADEKQMIFEINLVRSQPQTYLNLIKPYLKKAEAELEIYGPGEVRYSIETTYKQQNGKLSVYKIDTQAYYRYEEEVAAIKSLIHDLENLQPMSILQPDEGIYNAAIKHGRDQDRHDWKLGHYGSDHSTPMERIIRYAPNMVSGNENIAGRYPEASPREIVILLLIDSGIAGYGHRYNLLNPQWTHVACYSGGLHNGMYRWLQEFGEIRK
jgi:uncharacterized protein YkwD